MKSNRLFWFVTALAFAGVIGGCPEQGEEPSGDEICNGEDDDGDGNMDEGCDEPEPDAGTEEDAGPVDQDHDGFTAEDCDDNRSWVNPEATEVCNNLDDDCDCPGDTNNDGTDCGSGDTGVDEDCGDIECREDRDCDGDNVCRDNVCVPPPPPDCRLNSDCRGGERCENNACVPDIQVECREDRDCDQDSEVCNQNGQCVPAPIEDECRLNSDCGLLEQCQGGRCVPIPVGCREDRDCEDREICNQDDGRCESVECTDDDHCNDGVGCTTNVCEDNECTFEPDNGECSDARPYCVLGEGCLECTENDDCEDGLYCTVSEQCNDGECASSARDCGDGNANTVDSCNEASDTCDHTAQNVEVCDGADNDGDGLQDETFACDLGTTQACATGCGSTGSQTCAAGCVWGACTPPAESCNDRDDDCDGSVDENLVCDECDGAPNTIYVQASSGRVGDHLFWSDLEGENRFCEAGWDSSVDGAAPYEWTFGGTDGLHTINVQGPDGRYYVYIPNGNAGGACATRDGWTATVRINGVDRVVAAYDANRKSIEANSCVLDHEEGGWCNVICCLGGSACELDCDDGLDNDGNGGIDCADADCDLNRVYRPAGLCP